MKVSFDEPEHGWIGLSISYDEQSFFIDADSRSESFGGLVNALLGCLETKGKFQVAWLLEPDIAELHFTKQNEIITLEVIKTVDAFDVSTSRFTRISNESQLKANGSYAQICIPFWRALRALQGKYTEQELEGRMQDAFPTKQFAELTAQIKSLKLSTQELA